MWKFTKYDPSDFRVCPDTNFRVYKPADPLIIVKAVIAVLCLSIGGITALLMGLHKSPEQAWTLLSSSEDTFHYLRHP